MGEPTKLKRPTRLKNKHRADVIAAVRKAGATLSLLAERGNIHPSSLSHCLTRPLPVANRIIASLLGQKLCELWPEWYGKDGKRRPRAETSRNPEKRNREFANRRAA